MIEFRDVRKHYRSGSQSSIGFVWVGFSRGAG